MPLNQVRDLAQLDRSRLAHAIVHPPVGVGTTPMTAALNIPVAGKFSTAHSDSLGSSATDVDRRTLIILAFSATAGVFVEFYDFAIFGFAVASAFPESRTF